MADVAPREIVITSKCLSVCYVGPERHSYGWALSAVSLDLDSVGTRAL